MTVYHRHMTQRVTTDPYWRVNCGAYSGAMLINDSVLGGLTGITGKYVRSLSSEPVPDPGSPGLNIPQVLNVMRKLHVPAWDMTDHPWHDLTDALQEGRRVTLSIDYGELAEVNKCQGHADFGHQIVLIDYRKADDTVRGSDPLCSGVRRYRVSAIQPAARAFARQTGVMIGVRWAMTRQIPQVK